MSAFLVSGVFYVILFSWTTGFLFCLRRQIDVMSGKIAAMVTGMVIGFGGAVMVIHFLSLSMLSTTVISVFLGALAGGTVGAFINMSALLEGVLSGVMAGMMGSMLISMIPSSQWEKVLFFIMLIAGGIQFVLTLILQEQIQKEKELIRPSWIYRSPAMMFTVIGLLLFLYPLM